MNRILGWATKSPAVLIILCILVVGLSVILLVSRFDQSDVSPSDEDGSEPVQVTLWTANAELFLEYPPLLVGQAATFLAHLTDIRTFTPVNVGHVEVRFAAPNQADLTFTVTKPLRSGIFTPIVTIATPGSYEMHLTLTSESLTADFHIGEVQVVEHMPSLEASAVAGSEEPSITFLKEQQWQIAFATEIAALRSMPSTIHSRGTVKPVMGNEAIVTAPVTGLVVLPPGGTRFVVGRHVTAGEVLAAIAPLLSAESRAELKSAVAQATATRELARRELRRSIHLFEEGILSERRVEQAQASMHIAESRYEEATTRLTTLTIAQQFDHTEKRDQSQDFLVRAPLAGTLVAVHLTPGERIEAGEVLFTVIDLNQVWIEARVYAKDLPTLSDTSRASFRIVDGSGRSQAERPGSRLIAIGDVIDKATKTVPVIFEVENPDHRLKIAMHADVFIETGEPVEAVAIPRDAIVDEGGQATAYVQTGGESFAKRRLQTGITANVHGREIIQILAGISAGERVVTTGAYALRLAAASGRIPVHGH